MRLIVVVALVALALAAAGQQACSRTGAYTCPPDQACSLQNVCAPRCLAALCEAWNGERCVPLCTGCSACGAGGACVARPDLRNRCGNCPGDAGYGACAAVAGAVALDGPLVVDGLSVLAVLGNMTCDNRDAYARLPCQSNEQCATCDVCSARACTGGVCVAAPAAGPGCGACARDADCLPAPCVDARCRNNQCIRRVLPYCQPPI